MIGDYHTHTKYCDGKGELSEFSDAARGVGMKYLGFSSHAPLPFVTDWTMPEENFISYQKDFRTLVAKTFDIELLFGLEVDFIPGLLDPVTVKKERGLDYCIGAVHFLGKLDNGTYWTVDGSRQELIDGLNQSFSGNKKQLVREYYARVNQMALHHKPDFIAHFDLIKKNNQGELLFSEEELWYQQTVLESLDVIKQAGVVLEINTGGMLRKKITSYYPSEWIITECRNRRIPIVVNSDAHTPPDLTGYFNEVLSYLKQISCPDLVYLTKRGWVSFLAGE